jgi:putative MATE family efflux protein
MRDMTVGNPFDHILKFGIPLFLGSLLQQAYILIDSIIIGQQLGANELASVGVAGPIIYLIVYVIIGFAIGFAIKIAQDKGADDKIKVESTIRGMITLFCALGIMVTVFSSFVSSQFMVFMDIPDEILTHTHVYVKTILYGAIFQFLMIGLVTALRALGNSVIPLYTLLATSVLNIILDIVFIVFYDMGIFGAALATIITQVCGFIVLLLFLMKKNPYFKRLFAFKREDLNGIRAGVSLGMYPAGQHLLLSAGILALVWIVTPFGTAVIAAATIIGRIEMFVVIFFAEMGASLTTFVAQNSGNKNYRMIKDGVSKTIIFCSVVAIATTGLILLFPKYAAGLFTLDVEVIKISVNYIQILFPFFFAIALTNVMHGYLNGIGKTKIALLCTVYAFLLTRVPLSYILGHYFGIDGLWWAGVAGWGIGFIYTLFSFFKMFNKKNKEEYSERAIEGARCSG